MDQIDQHLGFLVCTSSTRPTGSDLFTGRTIFETDTKNRYFWTGTDWYLLNKLVAIKTADEIVNNSSTFQNDNHLVLSLDPGTWNIILQVPYSGPTGADLKSQYTFSGTSSAHRRYNHGPAGTGNDNANTIVTLTANVAFSGTEQYAAASGAGTIVERIIMIVTVAGTLQWQWAQNVATVGDTTVFTRGIMTAERLA
jgi:hypothetical protein